MSLGENNVKLFAHAPLDPVMVSFQSEYSGTNSAELEFGIVPNQIRKLVSTYSEKKISQTPGGHVPTCPLAGDATGSKMTFIQDSFASFSGSCISI